MTKLAGKVSVEGAQISFRSTGKVTDAVSDLSIDLPPGEFTSLLGPSGCGKSSLLGAIAGFVPLSGGQILIDGQPVNRPDRSRGIVFQDHNLFPWKTVRGNIEFGLKMRRIPKRERHLLTDEIIDRVNLTGFENSYPRQLSGGMQQRANLARVLVNRPAVLLLDEPFASLDAQTRLEMQELLLELWDQLAMTVVFVTHDVDEAILLSDRVVVMSSRPGQIRADWDVPLPRPRTSEQLTSEAFNELKRRCFSILRPSTARPQTQREPASSFACPEEAKLGDASPSMSYPVQSRGVEVAPAQFGR
ncbi:MAG: ABC transporter ATP-binding protein [Verrucomicrobia bacterium]|nr:ABC transporter ATP-binding protein [Verrucomicrobiota bacterium]